MADPWRFEKYRLRSGLSMRIAQCGPTTAPLILMLHGFPECWYSWRHQIRAFANSFDCAAIEMRGYGETDAPRGKSNYTLDKLVGDVAEIIEALGRKRAIVIGHDWGGGIAWATAMMRPDVVERLVVMNCPHPKRLSEELRKNTRQMLRSWYMLFFRIPKLPKALFRRRDYELLDRSMRDNAINKDAFSDDDLAYFHAAFRNPYSITAAINYYRANLRSGFMARSRENNWINRRIEAPTLVIWGERDFALGKELTYNMEPLFAGSFELKYIADAGHWVQQERPERVNEMLQPFLAQALARSD